MTKMFLFLSLDAKHYTIKKSGTFPNIYKFTIPGGTESGRQATWLIWGLLQLMGAQLSVFWIPSF